MLSLKKRPATLRVEEIVLGNQIRGLIHYLIESGKSHALLMDALQYINDPDFYAVYFRQNTTQLEGLS